MAWDLSRSSVFKCSIKPSLKGLLLIPELTGMTEGI